MAYPDKFSRRSSVLTKTLTILCTSLLLTPFTGKSYARTLNFQAESVTKLSSGGAQPFWLNANKHGLASNQSNSTYFRGNASGEFDGKHLWHFTYGADLVVAYGYTREAILQQAYIDASRKWLEISFGKKERAGEEVNPQLSSGSLAWSGNAPPIPELRIGTHDYVRLKRAGGLLSMKGHVSYGMQTDGKFRENTAYHGKLPHPTYTNHILFHSKSLFLKLGKPSLTPFEVVLGLQMYAQFGGITHNKTIGQEFHESYSLPDDLNAYLKILLPLNKPGEQGFENGNTVGSWHFSLKYSANEWGVRLYYEHPFEDHSSLLGIEYRSDMEGEKQFVRFGKKHNWSDGLYGLEFTVPEEWPLKSVVLEFLSTKGQCGPINFLTNSVIQEDITGNDDLYNHGVYQSYSHHGLVCGTPFVLSPLYNRNGSLSLMSNRLQMWHLGINGSLWEVLDYTLLASTARHWGTYDNPLRTKSDITSLMLSFSYEHPSIEGLKFSLQSALDLDNSELLGNNQGIVFSVSKSWHAL